MSRVWRSLSTTAKVVIGTALAFAALGFGLGRADGGNPWPIALVVGLAGLLLAGALTNAWRESQPFVLEHRVPAAADEIHDSAAQWFGRAPWRLAQAEPRRLAWWRETTPTIGVFIILLIFGILPGILYYVWARHRQTLIIDITPVPGGADVRIEIGPRLNDGRNRVVDFYNSLQDLVPEPPVPRRAPLSA